MGVLKLVNKDGSKEKAVKHILVLTLSEAHSEFLKSEKDCQVSLDVFQKLRPANVLLRHSLPKNVCVCIYHANINFLIALCVDPHCKVSIGQYTKMCTSPLIFSSSKYFR